MSLDLDTPLDLDLDLDLASGSATDLDDSDASSDEGSDDANPVASPVASPVAGLDKALSRTTVPIFKVFNMSKKEEIDLILVFYGFQGAEEDLDALFLSNPEDATFKDVFSPSEKNAFLLQDPLPRVKFINASLRVDDSIERIKMKIMVALENKYAIEEMYLFVRTTSAKYHPISVYEMLSQNEKQVPAENVLQFLSNIRYEAAQEAQAAQFDLSFLSQDASSGDKLYKYTDIAMLGIYDHNYVIDKPVGQSFIMGDSECPFAANPYNVNATNQYSDQYFKSKISILNSDILLNSGSIVDATIYLCLASNVLEEQGEELGEYIIKMYYPLITVSSVNEYEQWVMQERQKSIDTVLATRVDKMQNVLDGIDMFYDVYALSSRYPLKYSAHGIKEIKITMSAKFSSFLPLDTIFRLLHAESRTPLIKHTFSTKRDNVYRIYTDKVTMDGVKSPYLNISAIHSVSKMLSKVDSVAVYIEYFIARSLHSFICAFEESGDISIYAKFNDSYLVSCEEFNELVKKQVNPVLRMVKTQLHQISTSIPLFEDIFSPEVEVVKATYKCIVSDVERIDIAKNIGCISSAFNVESLKKMPAILRFKRVSNFNKLNSLEAFIIEQVNQDLSSEEIIEAISQNFNIGEQEAKGEFASFMSAQQVSVSVKKFGKKMKVNPGFLTSIEQKNKTIIVEVEGINDIQHLTTIPIYIDTMIRVSEPTVKTDYPLNKIQQICSGVSKEGVGDIVSKITEVPVEIQQQSKRPEKIFEPKKISEPEKVVSSPLEEEEPLKEVNIPVAKPSAPKIFGMDSDEGEEEEEEAPSASPLEEYLEEEPLKEVNIPLAKPSAPKIFGMDSDEGDEGEESPSASVPLEEDLDEEPLKEVNIPLAKPSAPKIFGMDSDGEEDEEEEEPGSNKSSGGAGGPKKEKEAKEKGVKEKGTKEKGVKEKEATATGISTVKLKNDNPFPQDRIKDRDPVLFESLQNSMNSKFKFSKTQNNFTSYSTMCASNIKRQPVILTKEELVELKKNPGALTGEWRGDKYIGDDVLEYGADPNNKNYYMCPRYWCLTTDKMLTHKQVLAGECGGVDKIIPKGASTPGDKTIYQFYDPSEHGPADEKGQPKNYQQHYPSFLSKNKTNDGYCLPCCFKNFNTPSHIAIKSECLKNASGKEEGKGEDRGKGKGENKDKGKGKEEGKDDSDGKESEKVETPAALKPKKKMHGNYIKGPEKFPLEFSRWGYIPIALQKFFDEAGVMTNCQVSASDASMKKFTKCLLRRGVEQSANQSFIACLASASQQFYEKNDSREMKPVLSIREFKNNMIAAITLDGFARYQNGGLINKFAKNDPSFKLDDPKYDDVNDPLLYIGHKKSRLYKKIESAGVGAGIGIGAIGPRGKMLNKVAQSFLQFKAFLNNDDVIIDYTYLWDFVCEKNIALFPQFLHGMNLVILNVVENDITNNIELVCPTNQQSSEVFNTHKNTLILMSKEGVFEPIYMLEDKDQNSFEITTTFSTKNGLITKPLRTLFDMVITPMFNKCTPYPSIAAAKQRIENIVVKRAIPLSTLLSRLHDLKYTVMHQVVNFQSKVIGVVARRTQIPEGENATSFMGFIPCYPSSLHEIGYKYNVGSGAPINYDFIFMDEHDKIWNTYDNTVAFLKRFASTKNVHKRNLTKTVIPCEPILRVIDNGVVVGLLTETNQFVQISDPFVRAVSEKDDYGLKDIDETGYLIGEPSDALERRPNVDEHTFGSKEIDKDRVEYIKRIKLEENFYNTFKNGVRMLMDRLENIKIKEELSRIVNNRNALYVVKMEEIIKLVMKMVKHRIQFVDMGATGDVLKRIDQVLTKRLQGTSSYEIGDEFEREILKIGDCILLDSKGETEGKGEGEGKSEGDSKGGSDCKSVGFPGFCKKQGSNKSVCVLGLPTVNLITNEPNNKEKYFEKVADEMIRYSSSKEFFFSSRPFSSVNLSGHNLYENEILILESALKQYFRQLTRDTKLQQDRGFTYDDAAPIRIEYNYVNEDKTADELMKEVNEQTCVFEKIDRVSSEVWNKCFRPESSTSGDVFGELIFPQTIHCTFELLFYILKNSKVENKSEVKKYGEINKMKTLLLEKYKKCILDYVVSQKTQNPTQTREEILESREDVTNQIVSILIVQSKKSRGDQVNSGDLNFAAFIEYPDYYLTILDLWILLSHFKVPCIFLSKTCLVENGGKELVGYSESPDGEVDMNEPFVFILTTAPKKGIPPQYKLITRNDKIAFRLNDFKESVRKEKLVRAIRDKKSFMHFITEYDVEANKHTCKNKKEGIAAKKKKRGSESTSSSSSDKSL